MFTNRRHCRQLHLASGKLSMTLLCIEEVASAMTSPGSRGDI